MNARTEMILERTMDRVLTLHVGELGLMVQNLLWGMWLLAPLDSMKTPAYGAMRAIMPEPAWGAVSFVLGLVLCYARAARWLKVANAALLVSCGWWLFVAIAFAMLSIVSTAVPTYVSISAMAGFAWIKSTTQKHR